MTPGNVSGFRMEVDKAPALPVALGFKFREKNGGGDIGGPDHGQLALEEGKLSRG